MIKQDWITDYLGDKCHYVNDVVHNDNGPAIIFTDGSKIWYKHGKRHREDGPAYEYPNGEMAWHYNGECLGLSWDGYTQEKFEQWKRFKAFI